MNGSYFEHLRPEMLPFVPPKRHRVLDIGCGTGNFVASIAGVDERWGVEPSGASDVAAGRLTRVFQGRFEDVESDLPQEYFDVIICNDVIEHMEDHAKFLRDVQKYLVPGGALVGSIPNVRFYNNLFQLVLEKDWLYQNEGILDRTHLAFFTEKSLRRTLVGCGFRDVRLSAINRDMLVSSDRRARFYLRLAKIIAVGTAGYFDDIRTFQFAFQAIRK
jgi:SAM-dependent methyltransferase